MSLIDMIPERDRAELRRNLFASPEFFDAVVSACVRSYGILRDDSTGFHRELDRAFERHGFQPSNPEHAAALAASLAEIERVIAGLETKSGTTLGQFRFAPEVRALAGPLRSAVERLRGLK